jgi:hypothetical protein
MNTTALRRAATTALVGITAAVTLIMAAPAALAQAQYQTTSPVEVKDWDVYVDLPTRFAFVKTPTRWVFVRQLDEEQMTRLPRTTLTALLPVDDSEIHYAHPSLEPSPRVQALACAETRQTAVTALATASAARQ